MFVVVVDDFEEVEVGDFCSPGSFLPVPELEPPPLVTEMKKRKKMRVLPHV